VERNRQDLWYERVFAGAMAGAAGFGIAGRNDRPVVRAQRQGVGRPRRADFVEGQSMDVVSRRAAAGLWAGSRRDGHRRAGADGPGRATERRTLADFGAVLVRCGRDLRFPFRAVGSDDVADPFHRPVADASGKHPLHLLRPVSGGGCNSADYVESAKADALECLAAQGRMTWTEGMATETPQAQSRKREETLLTISFSLFLCGSVALWLNNRRPNVVCSI